MDHIAGQLALFQHLCVDLLRYEPALVEYSVWDCERPKK